MTGVYSTLRGVVCGFTLRLGGGVFCRGGEGAATVLHCAYSVAVGGSAEGADVAADQHQRRPQAAAAATGAQPLARLRRAQQAHLRVPPRDITRSGRRYIQYI